MKLPSFNPDGPLDRSRISVLKVHDREDPTKYLGHVVLERVAECIPLRLLKPMLSEALPEYVVGSHLQKNAN